MNKFVKGAKNLAFALSFVTVAACGNVKKGDLETVKCDLVKSLGDVSSRVDAVDKKIENVQNNVAAEVQGRVKAEVSTQIAVDKKDILLGILKTDFTNLGNIIRMKGHEGLLKGFVFKGKFVDGVNKIVVEGKIEKDGFVKDFTATKGECSDEFFENFVKCGGVVEIEGLEKMVFSEGGTAASNIKIGDINNVTVENLIKFLTFLKKCDLLKKAGGLDFKKCFGEEKKFSCITGALDKKNSIKIIKAVCDEGSFDEGKLLSIVKKENVVAVTFKIDGADYSWNIAAL